MRSLVFVISDLHLGGACATDAAPSFQMCPPSTHRRLAAFIDQLPGSTDEQEVHLVIAGDIVDFLAEAPFAAFTPDPAAACAKLGHIFDSTAVVWDAINRFSQARSGRLTLMLGNHDIELSLPGVRQMFLERIRGDKVRFIYDNEAFTLGPLLVEHGNRFDAWNAVPHGALRRVRSQLSRRLPVTPEFPALPGSRMVIDVINPLKRDFPFIDLLKPENAVALPIAAALGAVGLTQAWQAFGKFGAKLAVDYDESSREPLNPNLVSAGVGADAALWRLAKDIAFGENGQQVSAAGDALARGAAVVTDAIRQARTDALYRAFRQLAKLRKIHRDCFDVGIETKEYLTPAQRSADAGFQVIVYGHTHLPKRVPLPLDDGASALYLNTGTWADVMSIPEGIWDADEEEGRALFRRFAGDLGASNLAAWRRSMPTYARIELDGEQLLSADLHFADDHGAVTSAGMFERLNRGS